MEAPLVVGGPAQPVAVYRRKSVHVLDREELAQRRPPGQVRRVLGYLKAVYGRQAAAAGSRFGGVWAGVAISGCTFAAVTYELGLPGGGMTQQCLLQPTQRRNKLSEEQHTAGINTGIDRSNSTTTPLKTPTNLRARRPTLPKDETICTGGFGNEAASLNCDVQKKIHHRYECIPTKTSRSCLRWSPSISQHDLIPEHRTLECMHTHLSRNLKRLPALVPQRISTARPNN